MSTVCLPAAGLIGDLHMYDAATARWTDLTSNIIPSVPSGYSPTRSLPALQTLAPPLLIGPIQAPVEDTSESIHIPKLPTIARVEEYATSTGRVGLRFRVESSSIPYIKTISPLCFKPSDNLCSRADPYWRAPYRPILARFRGGSWATIRACRQPNLR